MEGYIYKIVSDKTDKIYIGSTTKKLNERLEAHKYSYNNKKNITSKEIMKYDDAKIQLLEKITFNDKYELTRLEGHYIKLNKDKCVNKVVAGRTYKEYYIDNNDKIKKYYETNINKIKGHQNTVEICELCDKSYTRRNKSRHYKKYCLLKDSEN